MADKHSVMLTIIWMSVPTYMRPGSTKGKSDGPLLMHITH